MREDFINKHADGLHRSNDYYCDGCERLITDDPVRKAQQATCTCKEDFENKMRQFGTGATRDSVDHPEKPSYYKALSPIVLREYVKYLGRHRVTADGNVRDWDNWKKGIPMDVYMDGLLRHGMAVWLIQQGFKSYDNNGEVNLVDSLNGVLFNCMGMLHEILKEEIKAEEKSRMDAISKMIDEKFEE